MYHFFKHISLRLWVSLLAAWLTSLLIVPHIPIPFGTGGGLAMAFCFLLLIFVLYGWMANYACRSMIHGITREAESWEMAGNAVEAAKLLRKAVSLFDGFMLSPFARGRIANHLLDFLARFYLARQEESVFTDTVAMGYLQRRPDDPEVAENWLEQAIEKETLSKSQHRIVNMLVQSQPDNKRIQDFAIRICLKYGRTDFKALNLYHRIWRDTLDDTGVVALADLLLKKKVVSDWTLDVFDKASRLHPDDRRISGAVEAHARRVGRGCILPAENSPVGRTEDDLRSIPDRPDEDDDSLRIMEETAWLKIGRIARKSLGSAGDFLAAARNAGIRGEKAITDALRTLVRMFSAIGRRTYVRRTAVWLFLSIFLMIIIVVIISTVDYLMTRPPIDIQPVQGQAVETASYPFTIQAAAYLKREHAQRYVDQLMSKGVDAYILENRDSRQMLFHVRISRFTDKQEAREHAERLKKDGIIEDYYITNYVRP